MTKQAKMPAWAKLVIAASVGGGAVVGGQKLSTDSPVHFAVEGTPPVITEGWDCKPEGGLIGAPLVCHPTTTPESNSTGTAADTGNR